MQKCKKMAGQNTFEFFWVQIPSFKCVLNLPLVDFFKTVSQFLPNSQFRSNQVKKCLFSKGHIFGIFIPVS